MIIIIIVNYFRHRETRSFVLRQKSAEVPNLGIVVELVQTLHSRCQSISRLLLLHSHRMVVHVVEVQKQLSDHCVQAVSLWMDLSGSERVSGSVPLR